MHFVALRLHAVHRARVSSIAGVIPGHNNEPSARDYIIRQGTAVRLEVTAKAGCGGNHSSRSSTTPRRRCTCSPLPKTVMFDNHPESQAAQCLAQHSHAPRDKNKSLVSRQM